MFDRQLKYLLDILEISVTDLAEYARIDRTSISRMKNGSQQPKQNGTSIRKLIHGIISCCAENGKTDILLELTGADRRVVQIWRHGSAAYSGNALKKPAGSRNCLIDIRSLVSPLRGFIIRYLCMIRFPLQRS